MAKTAANAKFHSMGGSAEVKATHTLVARLSSEIGVDGYARLTPMERILVDDVRYKLGQANPMFGAKQVAKLQEYRDKVCGSGGGDVA